MRAGVFRDGGWMRMVRASPAVESEEMWGMPRWPFWGVRDLMMAMRDECQHDLGSSSTSSQDRSTAERSGERSMRRA